jgi:hypothetical protein
VCIRTLVSTTDTPAMVMDDVEECDIGQQVVLLLRVRVHTSMMDEKLHAVVHHCAIVLRSQL